MLIFIPMAGFGDRYLRAGYTEPKPLVPVDGVPMIARIVGNFPADARFLFGVNAEHANQTNLVEVLRKLRPSAEIVVLAPHKDGPIQTVLACAHALPDDGPVLLNYCDFGVDWSFSEFSRWLDDGKWDGAMTAYKGFHPHSLGPTLYAYMRNLGDRVVEIREKHHFTANKLDEYASSGLYWFRRGRDLKRLAKELVDRGQRVANEYYVSIAMQLLIEQGGNVGVYPLQHFYQWGTPEDLRDYDGWARALRSMDRFLADVATKPSRSAQVVPMAGRGQRFVDQGYAAPKPLIDTAGRPMIEQAIRCLPSPSKRVLVARREHARDARLRASVARLSASTTVIELDHLTDGQACTARLGVEGLAADVPVLFAPCDTGYVYDPAAWRACENGGDADLVVWAARGHLPALWRPQMYGWLATDSEGRVTRVAVKEQIQGIPPVQQGVVVGTFWFRDAATFVREADALVADNDRVNGEFYIDTIARRMVDQGKRVKAFVLDKYVPWGTPEELKTFLYWNDVFRAGRPVGG
jgi:NDP-sugar pyrophosphorylase family protein